MAASLKLVLTGLLALALYPQGSYSQQVSIVSPTQGTTISAGQNLNVVLNVQGTTSSVQYIAFSAGFRSKAVTDNSSLGRPYVGSVFPHQEANNVTYDASKNTYTFGLTVPEGKNFTDSLPGSYQFTISNYYLLGATFTPIIQLTGVDVNVQNGNGSSSDNSSQGGQTSNGTTGNGSTDNNSKPTGDSRKLGQSLFVLFTSLALITIGSFF